MIEQDINSKLAVGSTDRRAFSGEQSQGEVASAVVHQLGDSDFLRKKTRSFARREDMPSLDDIIQKVLIEEGFSTDSSHSGLSHLADIEKQHMLYREMHMRFFGSEPLFEAIPISAHDPRWKLVQYYERLKNAEIGAVKTQLQILTHTLYLEPNQDGVDSQGTNGHHIATESSIRQLLRGVANASSGSALVEAFHHTSNTWAEKTVKQPEKVGVNGGKKNKGRVGKHISEYEITLDTTKRIGKNVGLKGTEDEVSQGITPCPEALYQLRMWERVETESGSEQLHYIGRVGFNVHFEGDATVISVNNLQHSPNIDRSWLSRFKKGNHGKVVTDFLMDRLQMVAATYEEQNGKPTVIRGLANPEPQTIAHDKERIQELGQMYRTAFSANGIQTVRAENKPYVKLEKERDSGFNIPDSNFDAYLDWLENKHIANEEVDALYHKFINLAALVYPGVDIHSYTPEQKQIITEIIHNTGEIRRLGGEISDEDLLPLTQADQFVSSGFHEIVKNKLQKMQNVSQEASSESDVIVANKQTTNSTSIESTPEYRQLASLMFPDADINALSPEQNAVLHKIILTGKEILEQNPGITQEKLAQMISERVDIPGNKEVAKAAPAVETKLQEPVQEQEVEIVPQSNEHIITDEYYFNYLNGRFPQYGDLALQLFPGADLANLSPIQIEQIALVLNAGQEILKRGEVVTDQLLIQTISTYNIPGNIKDGLIHSLQPRVATESPVAQQPVAETPQRKLSLKEINQRGRRMQAIRRKIQQEQDIQSPYLQSKAVAMDLNGQVYRNGLAAAAVIPIDEHVAYVMVPGTEFRTMVSNWKDQKTVNAILHQKHPSASTTPTGQEWVLKSDYTGDEWQPKKKPEPSPRVVPPLDPTEADPADTAPLPPLQPNVPPTVPGYSAGPPLINPNRANSTLRNKSTGKGKKQAGEVAKTIAEATGSAALIAGKVAGQVAWITAKATGKVALKAGEATAKGAYKVATAKKTREIAWAVTKTTVKVAAYTVLSPVFMYVAAHDDFSSDEGVERIHSPAYWRWRKAGKMAGRAFHETGLAYMKFGAVGGEVFGDHETNEFVDKLYLKKSREWEDDDEKTRQRREQEAQITRSRNPVNWLGDVLNSVNPSVADIQRGHAETQAAWDKERRDNAYERLEHEYGSKKAKQIMADLENQGLSPKDIENAAKEQVNADRDAQQTEKTWGKIEKQHGKAVADQLRGSGADLTDMGLIHAADDIADRQRREKAAADAAEREARNREKAEAKVRKILGPNADEFLNQHADDPVNWIIEKAQQQSEKEQRDRDRQAYYEKQEQKQQEERQRKEENERRKQQEKLEREEEDRIKAEKRRLKEAADRAAQNAENPPQQRQQQQRSSSRTDAQPTPQSQPTTFVPPQPESRPQQQPQPAPQKPDQKPTQTRPSQDAKQGGGFFSRPVQHPDAQEEHPARQEAKPQQPQRVAQQPVERTPQPRTQRSPEPQPQRSQPPVVEAKPQQTPTKPPEPQEEVPTPPPVNVPVYNYTPPPPREEVKPEKQPEKKQEEQQKADPPQEPQQKQSAEADVPTSDEPEIVTGIHQSYTAEEPHRERISDNVLAQLHDRVNTIGENMSEEPDKPHGIATYQLRQIEKQLEESDFDSEEEKNAAEQIKHAIRKTIEAFGEE